MRLALPWPCYISLHNAMLIVCSFFSSSDNQKYGQNNIRYGIWSVRFRLIAIICTQHSNRLHFITFSNQNKSILLEQIENHFLFFCAFLFWSSTWQLIFRHVYYWFDRKMDYVISNQFDKMLVHIIFEIVLSTDREWENEKKTTRCFGFCHSERKKRKHSLTKMSSPFLRFLNKWESMLFFSIHSSSPTKSYEQSI